MCSGAGRTITGNDLLKAWLAAPLSGFCEPRFLASSRERKGDEALEQLIDHRHVTVVGRVALERRKDGFLGETQAVIRQDQHMSVALMFEVIVNAFFFTQPLQQCQVALLVLNTKRPEGIVPVGQFLSLIHI